MVGFLFFLSFSLPLSLSPSLSLSRPLSLSLSHSLSLSISRLMCCVCEVEKHNGFPLPPWPAGVHEELIWNGGSRGVARV
jgi:hypothetical protein